MPITNVIIIAGITFAFAFFAAVLAWGEYQTRDLSRSRREHAEAAAKIHPQKKAARAVGEEPAAVASGGPIQQALQDNARRWTPPGTDLTMNRLGQPNTAAVVSENHQEADRRVV